MLRPSFEYGGGVTTAYQFDLEPDELRNRRFGIENPLNERMRIVWRG
jgi:hypothetical protein